MKASRTATITAIAFALGGTTGSPAPAQAPQPDGAGLERGTLRASWSESSEGCETRPHFHLHEYNADLFILRQSGCTNYEKPFLYLLFGDGQALLLDSGAKNADVAGAVRDALKRWADRHGGKVPTLIVAHSHAHGDHVAGDAQLAALPHTTVIGTSPDAVATFFGIHNWPTDVASFDLGGRLVDIIPIPGHERSSIALYDRRTGLLLTGDTMYPGRLYVSDPAAFRRSVSRLTAFAADHLISHVLGAHIEQARTPYLDYPIGTKFQPDEHVLELTRGHLFELDASLAQMSGAIVRRAMPDFTVWPTGAAAGAAARSDAPDLDAIAKRVVAQEHVVGASVLAGHVLAHESDMAFNYDLRYCSTVGDLFRTWRAVRDHKLLRAETLTLMSTGRALAGDRTSLEGNPRKGPAP